MDATIAAWSPVVLQRVSWRERRRRRRRRHACPVAFDRCDSAYWTHSRPPRCCRAPCFQSSGSSRCPAASAHCAWPGDLCVLNRNAATLQRAAQRPQRSLLLPSRGQLALQALAAPIAASWSPPRTIQVAGATGGGGGGGGSGNDDGQHRRRGGEPPGRGAQELAQGEFAGKRQGLRSGLVAHALQPLARRPTAARWNATGGPFGGGAPLKSAGPPLWLCKTRRTTPLALWPSPRWRRTAAPTFSAGSACCRARRARRGRAASSRSRSTLIRVRRGGAGVTACGIAIPGKVLAGRSHAPHCPGRRCWSAGSCSEPPP